MPKKKKVSKRKFLLQIAIQKLEELETFSLEGHFRASKTM